jgi:hypothetical protein
MKNTVLTLIVLLLIAAGAYYLYKNNQANQIAEMPAPEEIATTPTEETTMTEEEQMPVTVELTAVDATVVDQSGQAVLTETPEGVEVELTLTVLDATTPQPAHIHEGACPGVGAVAYALENVVNGSSTTMLEGVTMADLVEMLPLAINVHKSATESSVYTACGDVVL